MSRARRTWEYRQALGSEDGFLAGYNYPSVQSAEAHWVSARDGKRVRTDNSGWLLARGHPMMAARIMPVLAEDGSLRRRKGKDDSMHDGS